MYKKEKNIYKVIRLSLVIILLMTIIFMNEYNVVIGGFSFSDIKKDSNGNYHKAFSDNSSGNYEIHYTNDIGGNYSQDWNSPMKISNSTMDSQLLDLGIYTPTDMMFIIWLETTQDSNLTYYSFGWDYGVNWSEPARSYENLVLKYTHFDPLYNEPELPPLPDNYEFPYAYYLVQFKTPNIKDWKDGIRDAGGVFCVYIPKNAYIIWMTPQIKDQIEQLPYIRWIDYYHPMYKIMPGLLNNSEIIEVNVVVFEETGVHANLDKVISEIVALGGIITHNGSDNYVIRTQIGASKIYDIALIPDVEWIDKWSESQIYTNNTKEEGIPWIWSQSTVIILCIILIVIIVDRIKRMCKP